MTDSLMMQSCLSGYREFYNDNNLSISVSYL